MQFIFSPEMGQKINFMGLIMKFQFLPQEAIMNFFIAPHKVYENFLFLEIPFLKLNCTSNTINFHFMLNLKLLSQSTDKNLVNF